MCKSTKERLMLFIEANNLSISAVALKSGIGDGKIRRADNLSCDTVCAILKAYPDLSAEWLMRGEGEMKKFTPQNVNNIDITHVSGGVNVGDGNSDVKINSDDTLKKLMEMQQQLIDYVTKDKR